uniref:HMG box domain-containing protein n=1 Tax=Culex tarsalis TaxID=7177 RepID=A0A1Q3FTN6_CULTA
MESKRSGSRSRRVGDGRARRVGRSCNPGRKSRNPYINFLREFRRTHCDLRPVEVIRQGALAWNRLTEAERLPYIREAFYHRRRR